MNRVSRKIISAVLMSVILAPGANAQIEASGKPISVPYTWKNVQLVGGGFVTGIIFHPAEKGLCYCRTDMGGAYRRNPETLRWEPLLDWISYEDLNLMGVESIALDPSNPDCVYMSCGTYTNPGTPDGAILRSDDRGKTFQRTNVPFKMGGNEDGRGNGERMSVDPNNGDILFLGTRRAGLWKSKDRAVTWSRVESFPDVTENPPAGMLDQDSIARWRRMNRGSGIVFTIIDSDSGSQGSASSVIYAGVSLMNRENLFRSTDSGNTWYPVPGQPVQYRPTHGVLASDGTIYITYGNSPGPSRMTDGGVWKLDTKTGEWTEITPDKPNPETRAFGYAAVSVDAKNPQVIIVSSYHRYGIEKGDDIFRSLDGGNTWKQVFGSGGTIESSLAPYTAFTGIHWLFDIEIDPFNPDHGRTWQSTISLPHPESSLGHIAVSSTGSTWIWAPDPIYADYGYDRAPKFLPVYYTENNGASWNECKGIPRNTRVIADRVDPGMFYGMDLFDGKFYISTNGGKYFDEKPLNLPGELPQRSGNRGDSRGGQDQIYATPGRRGDLWIAAFDGLYHSVNTGKTVIKVNSVSEIHGFGFGKAAPDSDWPALYLIGVINGVRGIFRSDDLANNWVRINDDQHQWGLLLHVTGDPKLYGRVYVGTHGRGALYGDPVK